MAEFKKCFYLIICFINCIAIPLAAQNNFIINDMKNLRIHSGESLVKSPVHRYEISKDVPSLTGNWGIFKNWNEGRAVVAENDSIVWVGTPVGLVRWNVANGTYKTFDENNGLEFTSVNSLTIDKNGSLWIAATQGLAVYSEGVFIHYNYNNTPLPESGMNVVCIDNLNRVVVAFGPPLSGGWYQDGGIARFDGYKWELWKYGSSIYWGPTFSMCNYRDTVWITGGNDLFILTRDGLDRAPGWTFGGGYSIAVDYQNNLWVESFGRKTLKKLGNGWQIIIDRDTEGMGGLFYDIWNDPGGGLWMSMRDIWWAGYGPYRLDIQKRRIGEYCGTAYLGICTVPGIPGQFYAQHALSDTSQFFVSIGTGTSWPEYQVTQGGLYKYDGSDWQVFRIPTTILQNEIYGLGKGHNGDIFLSTPFYTQKTNGNDWETIGEWVTGVGGWNKDFGFSVYDYLYTNHNPIYPMHDSYNGYAVGFDFDGYGNLWSTYPLTRFTWPGSQKTDFTNLLNDLAQPYHPQFMDVIVDKYEHVWAAAWYYGAVMFDGTNWNLYPPSDTTLPNGEYDLVFADSKGRIWFATNQSSPNYGFTIFNGKDWQTYYSPQEYLISYVFQIVEDHFGNIWLATGGGLVKYDGTSFIVFNSENSPLRGNYTTAVTVDDRGNIWVGTNNGLYIYNPGGPVEFGVYTPASPVAGLTLTHEKDFTKAVFNPTEPQLFPVTYQLQRGRGKHKFWTVSRRVFSSSIPEMIEIRDSSLVIGRYYYRINEVTSDGKQRYSPEVEYAGDTTGVVLEIFEYFMEENIIHLSWETSEEKFVKRFEVCLQDSLGRGVEILKRISPDSNNSQQKFYTAEVISSQQLDTSWYHLAVVYMDSTREVLKILEITPEIKESFSYYSLSQNYPNPFNATTRIRYRLISQQFATIKVFDVLGNLVTTLVNESKPAGDYSVIFDGSKLSSGIYFYQLNAGDYTATKKFILLK